MLFIWNRIFRKKKFLVEKETGMIRQSFYILQFFSGKSEVGDGVCVLVAVRFEGSFFLLFLWEISNICNQHKLQVLPGNFIDSKPIRNS